MNFFDKNDIGNIKIEPTILDKLIDSVSFTLLIGYWFYDLIIFSKLPETIPSHFNLLGTPDGFHSKKYLFILPLITTTIFAIIEYTNKKPQKFNFPVPITPLNAQKQYQLATQLTRVLRLNTTIFFFITDLYATQLALKTFELSKTLSYLYLPILLSLVLVPLIFYTAKMIKNR